MKKYFYPYVFIAIICLSFILRFYQLENVPDGLYRDETSIGYNAYSILKTGRDEHNVFLPTYFKSFGDNKLPAYIYLTASSIYFFGLNAFAVRFPSALFGSFSVVLLYFIVKDLTKNRKIALLSSFLLAINPLHLHFSRAGFEVNIALFFALFGTWSFLKGIESKRYLYFYLSVFWFVLSLYSYNVTRLLSPLIFLSLVFFNLAVIKKIDRKQLVGIVVFGIILLFPFLISFFSRSGAASAKGALITSTDIQATFIEMRSYLLGYPSFLTKLFFNKWILLVWTYLQHIVASLSPTFYFVTGSTHGNQGIGNVGVFYLFQFPLFIIGLITILKKKVSTYRFFIFWAIITILVLSLSKEVPHATRSYFIIIPITIFSAVGALSLWDLLPRKIAPLMKYSAIALVIGFMLFNIIFYVSSYYARFPATYAKAWNQQDEALSHYLKDEEKNYDKIVIDTASGFSYSSLLFYTQYDPASFLETASWYPDDKEGFSQLKSFGKYEFKAVNWKKEYPSSKNTLYVSTEEKKPKDIETYKMFYYPTRHVVVSDKETLISFPYQEPAYVVIKSPSL